MIVTEIKSSQSVHASLRTAFIKFILQTVRSKSYDDIVLDLVNEKLHKDLKMKINKICPVRSIDIRIMKFMGDATPEQIAAAPQIEEVKEQPKEEVAPQEER
jgi:ribosomal protein S3AE